MREEGFVSPILLALLALVGLLCLATADAANVLVARSRAQRAADAAALAAAAQQWPASETDETEPEDAARAMAEANGAELEACDCPERGERAVVTVVVQTRIRMLGVAPPSVRASAVAAVDGGRVFAEPSS